MKHITTLLLATLATFCATAQQTYWVFLADKAGTTFDPYTYFDAKAIERYQKCGANLYDITNYPVNASYEQGVCSLATEEVGVSRWMNAIGVVATAEQVSAIEALPYVLRVQPLAEAPAQLASCGEEESISDKAVVDGPLDAQLIRMGGQAFRDKGIDGHGVRIAVFDGGFPQVNTHNAFKHLRDNHQIIKTWNFPNKKEDVYGWNSHGTMTLSCIAGREGERDLGLATGAEFILARTEVNAEPFKEEIWWQMAVEWADRNGANIISSSLGYGKERHYTTDMDGTSYVARAGNLAARKGMLVCNSAGNEADDRQWRTIITPADADSVLCVGGIENSLTKYEHISFSSYGPSADGRQKPNVCAFGYARTANIGKGDNRYHYVYGTSFSCPLVAGFAACAWQASPGKTAMQMFDAIQRSADLYPYADYAFGYGVPQAEYFTSSPRSVAPTFRFVVEDDFVKVVPTSIVKQSHLFYSFRRQDINQLAYYGKLDIKHADENDTFTFSKQAILDQTLTIHLAGYTDSLKLPKEEYMKYQHTRTDYTYPPVITENAITSNPSGHRGNLKTSKWGSNAVYSFDVAFQLGVSLKTADGELKNNPWSPSERIALRFTRAFSKVYRLGIGFELGNTEYNYITLPYNTIETALGADVTANNMSRVNNRSICTNEYGIELFQRVRLKAIGITGKGLHWDLGVFGNYATNQYTLKGRTDNAASRVKLRYYDIDNLNSYNWNYGITSRLTYDCIGVYVRYRLNGIGSAQPSEQVLLPRLEVGLQIQY